MTYQPRITRFLIDPDVAGREETLAILAKRPDVPADVLPAGKEPQAWLRERGIRTDKTIYFLADKRGRAVKKCPGITDHYVCCNLNVLDQSENCPMACSYCFLQGYLNESLSTVTVNVDALLEELAGQAAENPRRLLRLGTGELSDSLALDLVTDFSRKIVPFVGELPNVVLELKTKSDCVENLLSLAHNGRTVVAWSVNPSSVNDSDEPGCVSLDRRLDAARRVTAAGYPVAFHFDPLLHYKGCFAEYDDLVGDVLDAVPVDRIAWVSLGTLRFSPGMRTTALERFPRSRAMLSEIVRGYDGKARLLKPLRHRLYEIVLGALRRKAGTDLFTYLCMEDESTWARFYEKVPAGNAELDFFFAESLNRRFPGLCPVIPRPGDYLETCSVPSADETTMEEPPRVTIP